MSFYIKLCAFVCLTFMLAWTCVVVCFCLCVCVCLLHAGPSVQGDNKHISPQSEAKQALPDSHQLADDHRFVLASSRLGEAVVVVPLQDLAVVSMSSESVRPSVGSPEFISPLPTGTTLHFLIFCLLTLRLTHQRRFSASFGSSVLVYLLFSVDLTSFPAAAVVRKQGLVTILLAGGAKSRKFITLKCSAGAKCLFDVQQKPS